MRGLPISLDEMPEKEWMAQAVGLAKQLGWMRYHVLRSKGSTPGWPDDALLRERLILVEWKTEKGKLSDAQQDWIRALLQAKVEVYVCRPRHLDELARILQARERSLVTSLEAETRLLVGL